MHSFVTQGDDWQRAFYTQKEEEKGKKKAALSLFL